MPKFALSTLLLCTLALSTACGTAQAPQTAAPSAADAPSINDLRSKYQAAFNAGDAAALAATFTDDAVSLPDHRAPIQGRAAIQQAFMDQFAQMTGNIQIMPVDTEINGETAYERGTYTMTLTPKAAGSTPTQENGKYVVILKKQPDGAWLIQHDINNTNVPPPAMPMPGMAMPGAGRR